MHEKKKSFDELFKLTIRGYIIFCTVLILFEGCVRDVEEPTIYRDGRASQGQSLQNVQFVVLEGLFHSCSR
jgi:hypothetical protein